MAEWRAATDLALPHLGDLVEVQRAVGTSGAVTFDKVTEASTLTPVVEAPEGTLTLDAWTGSGSFVGGSTTYTANPPMLVNANSTQLVIVTVACTAFTGGTPTPWLFNTYDTTGDPSASFRVGGNGTGRVPAHASFWATNASSSDASHTINVTVGAVDAAGVTCDVTVTVRTLVYV